LSVSFALFARDQLAGASAHQNQMAAGTPVAPISSNAPHGQPRRFIDSAAHSLSVPFASIVNSTSPWVDHGVPTLLGFIVYGMGLGFVARFSSGRA
jgi:hypothetical protein